MRAASQTEQVLATRDGALALNCGGDGPVSAEWMIPKALWLKENRPDVFADAAMICEYQDYVNLKLTGRYVRLREQRRRALALQGRRAADEFTARARPRRARREVARRTSCRWATSSAASPPPPRRTWASDAGIPVAQGGADAFVAMVGLGTTRPGQLALYPLTSALGRDRRRAPRPGDVRGVRPRRARPRPASRGRGGADEHGERGELVQDALRRRRGVLRRHERGRGGDSDRVRGARDAGAPAGEPHPHVDALSRGVVSGLTLRHGRAHVYRAILEGCPSGRGSCSTRCATPDTSRSRRRRRRAARRESELWMQIHADVAGIPFKRTKCADAPALGAAILAAVGAGKYETVFDAVRRDGARPRG